MKKALLILVLPALAACTTSNESAWTGGEGAGFRNAENSCNTQAGNIEEEGDRRPFFVACMGALGWRPKPGTSLADLEIPAGS